MHSRVSGVSDFLAINEHDGILKARQIVHNLNWQKKAALPKRHFSNLVEEPFYDPGPSVRCPLLLLLVLLQRLILSFLLYSPCFAPQRLHHNQRRFWVWLRPTSASRLMREK